MAFYAPRPPEQQVWQGKPLGSAALILLTAATFFGAQGQAPAKRARFDYVEQPVWTGTPRRSATIALLTARKFFGAGGQVPNRRWRFDYDSGASVWQPTFQRNSVLTSAVAATPLTQSRWRFDPPETTAWTWQPPPPLALITLTQLYTPGLQWDLGAPPDPAWQASAQRNLNLFNSTTVATPAIAQRWRFDQAEPTVWTWRPSPSLALTNTAPASPVIPSRWRFDVDAVPIWNGGPRPAAASYIPPPTTQVPPARWNYNYAADAFWQGTPLPSNIEFLVPAPIPPPVVLPPGGGGHRKKKPERPAWDEARERDRAAAASTLLPQVEKPAPVAASPAPAPVPQKIDVAPAKLEQPAIAAPLVHKVALHQQEEGDQLFASASLYDDDDEALSLLLDD